MHRIMLALLLLVTTLPAQAWNAAGHRLVAVIAWQHMSATTREAVSHALAHHPDYERWQQRARSNDAQLIFAEASTWPDDIRNDPRFYDDEAPGHATSGFADNARHKDWHYVDLDTDGRVVAGQLIGQLVRMDRLLRWTGKNQEISYYLPWLLHLVGDIHQPLHVGQHGDEGGNAHAIENPFNPRLVFTNLHTYWDDLPGPPWLRGKRLLDAASSISERHPSPPPRNIEAWAKESHTLLRDAYPETDGSQLPLVDAAFHAKAREITEQRIVAAGYRLGRLLNAIFMARVSRETH